MKTPENSTQIYQQDGSSLDRVDGPHATTVKLPTKLPQGKLLGLYQMIKSALPDQESRIVQFTSAYHGEGTNLIAFEFAIVAATQIGLRVLFADTSANHQDARLHLAASLKVPLGVLLQTGGSINNAKVSVAGTNLVYTTLRGREHDDSVLASRDSFAELLEGFRQSYDLIIIPSPAIMTDVLSTSLSRLVDGSILVVEAERTRAPVVLQVEHMIQANGGQVIGAILNKRRFYIPKWLYRWL